MGKPLEPGAWSRAPGYLRLGQREISPAPHPEPIFNACGLPPDQLDYDICEYYYYLTYNAACMMNLELDYQLSLL